MTLSNHKQLGESEMKFVFASLHEKIENLINVEIPNGSFILQFFHMNSLQFGTVWDVLVVTVIISMKRCNETYHSYELDAS